MLFLYPLLKKKVSFMNLTFLERNEQHEFHSFSHGKRSAFLSIFIMYRSLKQLNPFDRA